MPVVRFARPADAQPNPHPATVRTSLDPPPGEDPHTFFTRMMRLWTIGAERMCGIGWTIRVAENAVAHLHARRLYTPRILDNRTCKLLPKSSKLRSLAKLRLSQRPAPRRRWPLPPL